MSAERNTVASGQSLDRLTNWQIAVLVLDSLGGAHTAQETEDIAAKCYDLESQRFRWRKYDYPSLDAVKQALSDARRERHGALISGSARSGLWRLTPAGITWVSQLGSRSLSDAATRLRLEDRRTLDQLVEHPSFQHWSEDAAPPPAQESAMVLQLLPDAPVRAINKRISELHALARHAGRDDIEGYLQWLRTNVEP